LSRFLYSSVLETKLKLILVPTSTQVAL